MPDSKKVGSYTWFLTVFILFMHAPDWNKMFLTIFYLSIFLLISLWIAMTRSWVDLLWMGTSTLVAAGFPHIEVLPSNRSLACECVLTYEVVT